MIYFIVLFILLILTVRYDINGKTKYRDQWYNAMLIILILIAGLRFRLGEDTINYIYMFYHDSPDLSDLDTDTLLTSDQPPLWILLNSVVKTLGGKFFVVQLIQAAILNTLMLKYFKKHSSYPFACVILFFFWRYQWFNMVVMKAAVALSIMLFANDSFLEKKYLKGTLLMLLAIGFHQSSVVMLIVPFFRFLRFNMVGIVLIVFAFFFGVFLQNQLGDIFALFEAAEGVSNKLDNYLGSDFMTTENYNVFYFLLNIVPFIVYSVLSIVYLKRNYKNSPVLKLEPILILALIFLMMQFSIPIMYRYVYALSPYLIIFIVQYLIEFSKNSSSLTKSLAYFRSFVIILPLLVSIAYIRNPFTHPGFNPYSSVIERSIDEDREKFYAGFVAYYDLNSDEY